MPKVLVKGAEMHYETYGAGRPLVLVNGFGATTNNWALQIREFSKRFKVVVYDKRGSGRTPQGGEPITIDLLAEDAAGLLRALGIDRANVLGFSMGGWIAQTLAARYPEAIDKLVVACTSDRVYRTGARLLEIWKALADARQTALLIKEFLIWTFSIRFVEQNAKQIEMLERSLVEKPGFINVSHLDACLAFKGPVDLARIRAPTLVLTGAEDQIYPALLSRPIRERVTGSAWTEIPDCGHNLFWERCAEANRAVLDFLLK